jgi:ribosome-associated protein
MAEPNKMNSAALTTPAETPARSRSKNSPALPQDDVAHGAAGRATPERVARALERARIAARIADDNRAKEILLLDLRQATPLVDFFVIASASSRRQAYAIASEIDQEMKKLGEAKLGMEGAEEGRWILVDYGDFVVHVFSEDARTYYALEEIWGDAPRVDWRDPARARPGPPSPQAEPQPPAGSDADLLETDN